MKEFYVVGRYTLETGKEKIIARLPIAANKDAAKEMVTNSVKQEYGENTVVDIQYCIPQ